VKTSVPSEETLWRVVDILDRRPEHKGESLEELATLAVRTILSVRELAEAEVRSYEREQFERRLDSYEPIAEAEIARLVVKDKNKDRCIKRFLEFARHLMEPENSLEPESNGRHFDEYFESHQWPKAFVPYFQKLFPKWGPLKKAMSQRGKKKKSKKVLALTDH
jgi:hypothetical protein